MSVEPIKGVFSAYTNPLYGTLASELLRGYSAYNIAVMEGYEGTIDEWLASLVGPKGDKGDQGDPGLDGEQGPRGYTGETGPTGPKGDKGDKGETGNGIYAVVLRADYTLAIYFTDGSVYNTPSIRGREGAVGPTGPIGPQGETGAKGDKGDTGDAGTGISSIVQNADHSLTINLDDGTSYTTDPVEALKGDKGDTGNGISSIVMKSDYTLQINMTNGTSYNTPSIRGVQGETGPKGDTGATGPKGDKGDKGDPGALNFHICSQTEYDATTRVPTVQSPEDDTFYLVPSASVTSPDLFVEWIYVNNAWEMFGSATVDLTQIEQDIDDLKETLSELQNLQDASIFRGSYSGTLTKAIDVEIPSGSYTVTVDTITSTDTDADSCLVIFRYDNNTDYSVYFSRGNNVSQDVTFARDVAKILFYASDTYSHSRDDQFSFTGLKVLSPYPLVETIEDIQNDVSDVTDELSAINEDLSNLKTGYLYVPSQVKTGYLDTSGNLVEEALGTAKRVTFVDYVQLSFPCEIYIDAGYSITLCLYNSDKTLDSRTLVASPNRGYVPQNTLFRLSVISNPETVVTDVVERSHHCRIIGTYAQVPQSLTSSDDVDNVKEPGLYAPSSIPVNWPGGYGVMTVLKGNGGTIYQTVIDSQGNYYVRRYSTSVGWISWKSYAKASDVNNSLAPAIGAVVDSSNYSNFLTDANTATTGRMFMISSNITSQMIANLPSYGRFGYLITFNALKDNNHGRVQLFAQKEGSMWYRTETGSGTTYNYSSWQMFATGDLTDEVFMPGASEGVSSSTYTQYFTDANLAPSGRTYYIVSNVTAQMVAHLPIYGQNGFLMTFRIIKGNSHARIQMYSVKNTGQMWYRYETGSGSTYNYTQWYEFATKDDVKAVVPLAAKIFKRVGCIGDSYTAGYINIGGNIQRLPAYAWPHYMEGLTGHIWTNFGVSGSSCKSWVNGGTYSKLSEVQASGNKCQAYVIGLGLNDSTTTSPNYVAVGTSADIGTDADSYYAYYYKLIAAVHAVNADAPIFCNTCPQSESRLTSYNQAVRDVVAYCKQHNMPVYLCDLAGAKYYTAAYYNNPIFTTDYLNSHYSTIGYEMMAECYLRVLSEIIVESVTDFQNVHLIDYDEPSA